MSQGRSKRMEARRHALLDGIAALCAQRLEELGVASGAAELVANAVADDVAELWGGQTICIPKDYARVLSRRDMEIYEAFDGRNVAELALRYGLTERGMYKLLKRIRERLAHQARGAPDLFSASHQP